ncbi:dihydroneopterin aldolase [Robiginitalea sp.]|uniref:dihydroneopterin aldolase n=1 Tax=Robiginitalea sp. TaxID=1902411 RepID=UPI003C77419D
MGKVRLENIRLYAFHGCLKEEGVIGSDYRVDLEVTADLEKASVTDQLADTVDYVTLHRIVQLEMDLRSHLLETVGARILDRIFKEVEGVSAAEVSISKINPPIGGDVQQVTVVLSKTR